MFTQWYIWISDLLTQCISQINYYCIIVIIIIITIIIIIIIIIIINLYIERMPMK